MNNSVVFAGFATSLATRIVDAQAKLVITADAMGCAQANSFKPSSEEKHLGDLNTFEDLYTENQKV
jgi:acyl-coenzyme A synthetase/AMP-(fatty) acid ligase